LGEAEQGDASVDGDGDRSHAVVGGWDGQMAIWRHRNLECSEKSARGHARHADAYERHLTQNHDGPETYMGSGRDIVVAYDDGVDFTRPGEVFYPESLRRIAPFLAALNSEAILRPSYFNANIELYLDHVMGLFRSLHATHETAKRIHRAYREHGRQYWVYLRSFALGGVVLAGADGEHITQRLGLTRTDQIFRAFLNKAAGPVEGVSFINIFDSYPSGLEADDQTVEYMRQVTIPSVRLLSHNWKEIVREVVRGAKFVAMNVETETGGVEYELDLIRRCDMNPRTIVLRRAREGPGSQRTVRRCVP
jgi:hypothetical protein